MNFLPSAPRSPRAFTLVELLVVILVVAILGSLSFVGLRSAKRVAERAACASSLRQLGSAVHLYAIDHNDRFPPYLEIVGGERVWYFGIESGSGGEGDRQLDASGGPLFPYINSTSSIEICPSFNYQSPSWKAKFDTPSWGYGYNWRLGGRFGGQPMRRTAVKNPVRCVLFGDCAQINTFQAPASPSNPMLEEFYIINESFRTIHFRHNGLANILFVDGHVEAMQPFVGTELQILPGELLGRITASGSAELLE